MSVKLIFTDLDGALLRANKTLPEASRRALERAAAMGVQIVPVTGRSFSAMPECIRVLPFINYAITSNGAQVWDLRAHEAVAENLMPASRALEVLRLLDGFGGIYDCCAGDGAYMDRSAYDSAENFISDGPTLDLVRRTRQPVEVLSEYIAQNYDAVQKCQIYFQTPERRDRALEVLKPFLSDLTLSPSDPATVEITARQANRGEAVRFLMERLGVLREETLAFGSRLGDGPIFRLTTGVAMEDAAPALRAMAAAVTGSAEDAGVAQYLFKTILRPNLPVLVCPSVLSADFWNLGADIQAVEEAEIIHYDVMDNHFVPNLSFGFPVLKSLRRRTEKPIDVHLMVSDPMTLAPQFCQAGADLVSFHVEAAGEKTGQVIASVKSFGRKVGLALKPGTPAQAVFPYLNDLDFVLVMTVEPGFGGQSFMYDMLDKVSAVRYEATRRGLETYIQVDGGVDAETAPLCVAAGANMLVSGSTIFRAADKTAVIRQLRGEQV